MIVLIVLICTFLLCTYKYGTRNFDYWKLRGVPYIEPRFFFGIIYNVILKQELAGLYLAKFYNKFKGPYFGFYAFHVPFLVLTDPDMIVNVLITNFQNFSNRYLVNDDRIDPVITYGLFGAKELHWRTIRPKISPLFTLSKVKSMFGLLKECSLTLTNFLDCSVGCNVNMKDVAKRFSTNAVARCVFGVEVNSFKYKPSEFQFLGKKMFSSSITRTVSLLCYYYCHWLVRLLKLKFVDASIQHYMFEVFEKSMKYREESKVKGNDMMDYFVELNSESDDSRLSFVSMAAQAVLFQVAGSESIASTMAYTLHELCLNQKIQDKLRTEIQGVMATHAGLTYEALHDMKYLNMVVQETLRKYPSAPMIHRKCVKDHKIPNMSMVIEKGTNITISSFGLHRNSKYFSNPETYDPERFNDHNKHNIRPGTYLPFGFGPRACIAETFALMIAKVGVIEVLTKYRVVMNEKTVEPVEFTMSPVLVQPKHPLSMTIQKLH